MKIKTNILEKGNQDLKITKLRLRVSSLDINYRLIFSPDAIIDEFDDESEISIVFQDTAEIKRFVNLLDGFKAWADAMKGNDYMVNNMIDKKEIERACNSFFKEATLHSAGNMPEFVPEIILNANCNLMNMIRNTVETYQSKYRENLEMHYICKMALEYLKIVERGKEQVNNMGVIILDAEDMEALQNGEMIHLQVNGEQTVGLATEKWAEEKIDD